MIFTSFTFLLFLLAAIAVYFLCPVKWRWIVLLLASVVFYCLANVMFLPFLAGTALIAYASALLIHRENQRFDAAKKETKDKEAIKALSAASQRKTRGILAVALALVLGYLGVTKFGGFITSLFTSPDSSAAFKIIVPLGISYYSFSTVGYVLDIYWKRYQPEKNFFRFLLYVIYFPHILQGPIARYNRLGVQFAQEHRFDYKRFCFGLQLVLWGFFQKLVIADRLGTWINSVYGAYQDYSGAMLLIATLFYAVQIYADFSACVNIAKGVSQVFGIELEDNFRQPYFSRSVDEFWRRWHMTLGAWFKDYLCIPVSISRPVKALSKSIRKRWGSRAGKNATTISALIAVWIATGVWHGTGLNYVIWGLWQGGIIALSVLMEPLFEKAREKCHIKDSNPFWRAFQMLRTFVLTGIIPRIIVRSSSLEAAGTILGRIFNVGAWSAVTGEMLLGQGLSLPQLIVGLCAVAVLIIVSVLKERGVSIRETVSGWNIVLRWCVYLIAIFIVLVFGVYGPGYEASSFAYMKF